jgi:DDE superfamily endonuclease
MALWTLPLDVLALIERCTDALHARTAHRLAPLLQGILFARGRRTVTSWLRAAGVTSDFRACYYFIAAVGRQVGFVAGLLFRSLLNRLAPGDHWLFALDDTPTARYGPYVEGAGVHRNPTPGPSRQQFVYGHIWVTLAWVLRHPCWGTLSLPLLAWLYIRQKDLPKVPPWYRPPFRTKLALAADLLVWLATWLWSPGKPIWVVVDGFYGKRPFLQVARDHQIVVVGRLRRDAALWSVPPAVPAGRRRPGRPRRYGRQRFSLAKRAGQARGWQTVAVVQYQQRVTKTIKTFLATWKPAGGLIRVVLVREEDGWRAYFCTDPQASAEAMLEAAADRTAIEQTFHDVKEVDGAGQQQVRNLHANVGAFNLNLWAHTLVEWWAWERPQRQLCDRRASPWDDATRRPSHADRRKALQRTSIEQEFQARLGDQRLPRKILQLLRNLLNMVA